MLTADDVLAANPGANPANVRAYWPYVVGGLARQGIDSVATEQAAAATIITEVGLGFAPVTERASGAVYDTGSLAVRLGNTPEADGDGERYKGRGFIQLTGLANYRAAGQALGVDLVADPDLANNPEVAGQVLGWYFKTRGVNRAAEAGDWEQVRRLVNGGLNGWETFWGSVQNIGAWLNDRAVTVAHAVGGAATPGGGATVLIMAGVILYSLVRR